MRLDWLRSGLSTGPLFTPNVAVAAVNVTGPAAQVAFFSPSGTFWFEAGDNVKLRRINVILPHGLSQGIRHPQVMLRANVDGFGVVNFSELNNSTINLASLCGFTEVGIRLQAPTAARWSFVLPIDGLFADVSMLGVPALIGVAALNVTVQIEVEHTRDLTA